jgi:hypothetical protein
MTENRNGFVVESELRQVTSYPQWRIVRPSMAESSIGRVLRHVLCIRHAGLQRVGRGRARNRERHDRALFFTPRSIGRANPPMVFAPPEWLLDPFAFLLAVDEIVGSHCQRELEVQLFAGRQAHHRGRRQGLRVAQVDRSNRLNDSRLPNGNVGNAVNS